MYMYAYIHCTVCTCIELLEDSIYPASEPTHLSHEDRVCDTERSDQSQAESAHQRRCQEYTPEGGRGGREGGREGGRGGEGRGGEGRGGEGRGGEGRGGEGRREEGKRWGGERRGGDGREGEGGNNRQTDRPTDRQRQIERRKERIVNRRKMGGRGWQLTQSYIHLEA